MMKTQIGLGVLSIPIVFGSLGIIPGVILLCTIAGITTWSGYIVGVTKNRYPHIYGLDDTGDLMFGRIGREVFGLAFVFCKWATRTCLHEIANHGGLLTVGTSLHFQLCRGYAQHLHRAERSVDPRDMYRCICRRHRSFLLHLLQHPNAW